MESETSALISCTFPRRTRRGPVVEEYMRTTSWISFTWFWIRPTWERRSDVVTLMSAAGPLQAVDGSRASAQGLRRAVTLN